MCEGGVRYISVYALKVVSLFAGLLVLLTGLAYAAATIDRDELKENVRSSLRTLSAEGDYYRPVRYVRIFERDNFTDALMIGSALAGRPGLSDFENMLTAPFFELNDSVPATQGYYGESMRDCPDESDTFSYSRYWHGYNVTLRPMLTCMDISSIRVFNYILLLGLVIWVGALIYRRFGQRYCVVFALALLMVDFPFVPATLQFTTCFLICFVAMAIVLTLPQKWLERRDAPLIFLVIGGVTSFFDFLTTPLITFGLPATVILLRRNRLPDWRFLILCALMWGAGYAGIWVSKWILTAVFTDYDIFGDVTGTAAYRSGAVTKADIVATGYIPLCMFAVAVLGLFVMSYAVLRKGEKVGVAGNLSLIAIGLTPLVWVMFMRNHSFIHYWFVWRILAVSFFAIGSSYVRSRQPKN